MFNKLTKTFIIVAAAIMALQVCTATAGYNDDGDYVNIKTRKLNGPRIGLTFVPDVKYLRRNGDLVNGLKESDIGVIISQFGCRCIKNYHSILHYITVLSSGKSRPRVLFNDEHSCLFLAIKSL